MIVIRVASNRSLALTLAAVFGVGGACGNVADNDSFDDGSAEMAGKLQGELDATTATTSALSLSTLRSVRPVLKCVEKVSTTVYRAHFGYASSAAASIPIPVGFFNRFFPPPTSRGQPTVFVPGAQADVVQVSFNRTSAVAWVLGLNFQIATAGSKACPATGGSGGAAGTGGTAGTGGRGGSGGAGGAAGVGGSGTGGQGQCPSTCDDHNPCTVDLCSAATGFHCSNVVVVDGTSCSDGNACTTTGEACRAGVCVPGVATMCTASDRCHVAGVCNPATGACSNPVATNGVSCSDNNSCNGIETCQAGVCTPGSPLACPPAGPCQVGSCDPAAGCVLTSVANGTACQSPGACGAGICQAGACVSTAQTCDDHNPCTADACGPTGACTHAPVANGRTCSDGNACNGTETCQAGVCTGGTSVTCVASDQCHVAGVCDPATGACSNPARANGSPCSDNNTCTRNDACMTGQCVAGTPITCIASDQCHVAGTCDPLTGLCLNPPAVNGTACSDGNPCSPNDSCQIGICVSVVPPCPVLDQCHAPGQCDPATGVCSNPVVADGTACNDGTACTQTDRCVAGACLGSNPVTCNVPDQCHAAVCDATTGACVTTVVANGTPCSDGDACTQSDTCQAGTCAGGNPTVCASPDGCHPGVCDHTTGTCSNPLACHLYGVGSISGTAVDGLAVSPATLEDGVSNNRIGGLGSAIAYTGVGNLYVATPDRGPNDGLDSYTDRYYLIEVSLGGGGSVSANLRGAATLNKAPGQSFIGLSSAFDATNSPASLRFDPEGVRVGPSGSLFVSDEYGPFVYEFGADGNRIRTLSLPNKFLIDQPNANGTLELPPGNTKGRQSNRGMEGLAISPDGTRLFGMMQSPLIQDGGLNAANSRVGTNVRILEYVLATNVTHEYLYQLTNRSYGISEIVAVNDHQFLVLERDGNAGTAAVFKQFFLIDVNGATDVSGVAMLPTTGTPAGVTPVSKTPFLDMLDSAYGLAGANFPEKVEGIAFGPDLPDGRHVVVITNDSDFLSTNNNNFYVFTVDPIALPGFQPQPATFPTACVTPAPVTCPASNECRLAGICRPDNGQCNQRIVAAGSATAAQSPGDCHQNQCDATGQVVSAVDNADVPVDSNQCTNDVCSNGTPSNPPVAAHTPCNQGGGTLCDGSGACVQCVAATDCPGTDGECSFRTCTAGVCGVGFAPSGQAVAAQAVGDCHRNQCDGAGNVVSAVDDGDVPNDGNSCTLDVCSGGTPSNPPAPLNTACSAGVCDGNGSCVGCTVAAQCPGVDSFCGARTCTFGVCGFSSTPAGTPLPTQIAGNCKQQVCDGVGNPVASIDNSDLPVDGNVCTSDVCTAGVPSNPAIAYGTSCGTNLICNTVGACVDLTFRVVRIGDGTAALGSGATRVFVEERRFADGLGVGLVSLPIAVSGSNRSFTNSGSATSEGALSLSADGRYLVLGGYDAAPGTAGIAATTSAAVNRVVARIDAAGSVDTSTRLSAAFSANNIRTAASVDGSGFWAGGAGGGLGGAWYVLFGTTLADPAGAPSQVTALNTRVLAVFGNQLYGSSSATPFLGVYTIGSGVPQSGPQTSTMLPGETSPSSYGFALLDLDPGVSGADTLYLADDTAVSGNTGGGVQKWTSNGSTWTRVRTFTSTTTAGFRGIAARVSGTNVSLIGSTADGSLNRLVAFTDDGAASPVTVTGTTLVTAPTNTIFRGVALSPRN